MDTNANPTFKRILFALMIGFSTVIGVFFLPAFMLLPAFLAYIAAAWGTACFAAAALSGCAGVLIACRMDIVSAIYFIMLFLPASVVLAVMLTGRRPYRTASGVASALFAAALYAMLCLNDVLAGRGTFDTITAAVSEVLSSFEAFASSTELTGMFPASLPNERLSAVKELVPAITASFIVLSGMGFGFLDTVIAHALMKRAGTPVRRMAPMREWQLTKSFMWGALILIAGMFLVKRMHIIYADAIGMAIELIVLLPYALMGVCFYEFMLMARGRNPVAGRVLGISAGVLLMPYSVYGLAACGVIDRIFHIRERIMNPPAEF